MVLAQAPRYLAQAPRYVAQALAVRRHAGASSKWRRTNNAIKRIHS